MMRRSRIGLLNKTTQHALTTRHLVEFRAALPAAVLPLNEFDTLRAKHGVTDRDITLLEQAGVLLHLGDCVHGHPSALLLDANEIAGFNWDCCASEHKELEEIE